MLCAKQWIFRNKNSVFDQQEKWENFDSLFQRKNVNIFNYHANRRFVHLVNAIQNWIKNWFKSQTLKVYNLFVCFYRFRFMPCKDIKTIQNILLTTMHLFHRPSIPLNNVEMLISFVHVIVLQWKRSEYTMFVGRLDCRFDSTAYISDSVWDGWCFMYLYTISLLMMVMYSHSIYNIG